MLIGIAGKAGAGKDTAARYLIDKRDMHCVPFALFIKKALNAIYGWEMWMWEDRVWKETAQPEIGHSPRYLAQKMGTEFRDATGDKHLWINALKLYCVRTNININNLTIPDVRFEHEQDWIHKNGGQVWYIQREVSKVHEHISEVSLNPKKVDVTFLNDRTVSDLYHEMGNYMAEMGI